MRVEEGEQVLAAQKIVVSPACLAFVFTKPRSEIGCRSLEIIMIKNPNLCETEREILLYFFLLGTPGNGVPSSFYAYHL